MSLAALNGRFTKESGKGTGLGLATAFAIVRQHDGWFEVSSQLGQGTTVRVMLPLVFGDETAAAVQEPPADSELGAKGETISSSTTIRTCVHWWRESSISRAMV